MTVLIIIQVILAVIFLMAGIPKFTSQQQVDAFEKYGYPQWFRTFTAIVEVVAGVLVFVGIWIGELAAIGGLLVILTMIGAIITHIKLKDRLKNMVVPIVLLGLGVIVLWVNASYFLEI